MVSSIERFHCIQDSQLSPNGVLYRQVPLYTGQPAGSQPVTIAVDEGEWYEVESTSRREWRTICNTRFENNVHHSNWHYTILSHVLPARGPSAGGERQEEAQVHPGEDEAC